MATHINGVNVEELEDYRAGVGRDHSQADRNPTVVATWLGASRSRVTSTATGGTLTVGGDDELNPMLALLGTLAACDVDLVAMHAALMGVEIETLGVEATGSFNVARYLGFEAPEGPGYQRIDYRVRLHAPVATNEQITRLRELCIAASPVGDTLGRNVDLHVEFDVEIPA